MYTNFSKGHQGRNI